MSRCRELPVCGKRRRKNGTGGLKLPMGFPRWPKPHLPLVRPAGWRWWLVRESRAASTQTAPPTPGPPSSSPRGSGIRRRSAQGEATPLKWGEGRARERAGEGQREPHSPTPSAGQGKLQPGTTQPAWGRRYHCGEPHGGVNEEFWGLWRPLLDPPKSDRHAGGAQDYEGEPKHLGRQA